MAFVINTNTSSLNAQSALNKTQMSLKSTITSLSTGQRINSAADDPAGLAISQSMQTQIRQYNQANRNANDGISLVQTAQGSMNSILNSLQQMTELATQAANGTYSSSDLTNLDTQFQALFNEIDRVSATSSFNGINLLNATGNAATVKVQVGISNTSNDQLSISLTNTTTGANGINITGAAVDTAAHASSAIATLKTAIQSVTTGLATLGAAQTNLQAAFNDNTTRSDSLSAANSQILDTDFAKESANLSKFQVLQQAGVAMLAQANQSSQSVLKLLG